jgi:hypothetical protein
LGAATVKKAVAQWARRAKNAGNYGNGEGRGGKKF